MDCFKKRKEKRTREEHRQEKKAMNNYLSIINLSVNGLNAPIKRHRIAEWIRKHDPHICCLQETHFRTKDLHRLKVKGWKQIFKAQTGKKSRGSNTHIRQNRLQKQGP